MILGELEEDLSEWELIDEREVDYEEEDRIEEELNNEIFIDLKCMTL